MSATKVNNTPRDFHVSIVGEEKVEQFESKFPQIVKDEAVYIAYLQRYYKGHEDEFIDLKEYTLDELKEKIFSGEIEDSKTVSALMAYAVKFHQ